MNIKDIQARQGNISITAEVLDKGEVREFEKFGKSGRVCNAKIKDETGEVSLTLWNEQIEQVNPGDKITITNGWCSEFQGELQLSTGKFGKLEISTGAAAATEDNKTESEALAGSQETPPSEEELTSDEATEAGTPPKPEHQEEKVE